MEISKLDWNELDRVAKEAIALAQTMAQKQFGHARALEQIGRDITLEIDQQIEEAVIIKLNSDTPFKVIGEESIKTLNKSKFDQSEIYWILDPLDGSFNYFREIPLCAFSLALVYFDQILYGRIGDFNTSQSYSGGIYTPTPLRVSSINNFSQAVLGTGFPSNMDQGPQNLENFFSIFPQFKKVRMLGSAALTLLKVAQGQIDVYMESNTNFWDVAAGLSLVRASGGDYLIRRNEDWSCQVLAWNGSLDVQEIWKKLLELK